MAYQTGIVTNVTELLKKTRRICRHTKLDN